MILDSPGLTAGAVFRPATLTFHKELRNMYSLKYLNGVLTVLAVVLTLNLWVTWTDTPASDRLAVTQQAHAQGGPPNAAQQRREMVDLLKQTNRQLDDIKSLLTSGNVRVRAELPEPDDAVE